MSNNIKSRVKGYDEELMSVDEHHSVASLPYRPQDESSDADEQAQANKVKVKTRDLHNKDNYLFFELFSLYTKQQMLRKPQKDQDDHPPIPKPKQHD